MLLETWRLPCVREVSTTIKFVAQLISDGRWLELNIALYIDTTTRGDVSVPEQKTTLEKLP